MSHSLHHTIQKIACIKPILESNSYSFWFGVLLVLWRQQLSDLIPKVSVTKLWTQFILTLQVKRPTVTYSPERSIKVSIFLESAYILFGLPCSIPGFRFVPTARPTVRVLFRTLSSLVKLYDYYRLLRCNAVPYSSFWSEYTRRVVHSHHLHWILLCICCNRMKYITAKLYCSSRQRISWPANSSNWISQVLLIPFIGIIVAIVVTS